MNSVNCQDCGAPLPDAATECPSCATRMGSRALDPPNIEGYRVVAPLGAGGMGQVFLAEDVALHRRVVIKVIADQFASDVHARARFLREARAMAAVEHAHVVRVYGYGEVDGRAYLVMELVDGESLAERLRRVGAMPVVDALRFLRHAVAGLEAAWEKHLVHRDVKPANMLLDAKGDLRVADFGLAKPMRMNARPATLRPPSHRGCRPRGRACRHRPGQTDRASGLPR
jgi:serine/threonine-protein kinase